MSSHSIVDGSSHTARSAEISLGIRAARALGLVRRAQAGEQLNERDVAELESMRQALRWAADAAVHEAPAATIRGRRNIASVGLALTTAMRDTPQDDRPSGATALLRALSDDLDTLVRVGRLESPSALLSFLRALVDTADRATARTGETLVAAKS
jgi:hypothetical protein